MAEKQESAETVDIRKVAVMVMGDNVKVTTKLVDF